MFSKKRVSTECFIAALILMAFAAFVTIQLPTTAYASEILYSNELLFGERVRLSRQVKPFTGIIM